MSNLIYGHHPVIEAILSGKSVEKVYFQQGIRGEQEKQVRQLTKEYGIPLQVVPKEKLNKMVRGNHQGIAAWLALIEFQDLESVIPFLFEQGKTPLLLMLDNITDVRNFGAICRSAECMGVDAVVIPQAGNAPANEDAMKASAGALSRISICRVRSIFSAVDYLKESGIQILSTALTGFSVSLPDADFGPPSCVILGAEGRGVHPKLNSMADKVIRIPQASNFDSLNVSVAAGVVLYEALRQRGIENE